MASAAESSWGKSRWHVSNQARTALTRVGLLLLLIVAVDGALTWYVTDQAAAVVADIQLRDGAVVVDESELGATHRSEIERASGADGGRIHQGGLKWIPAVVLALVGGLMSSRADPALRRSVVMAVALTLAIWVTPRVVYSRELPALEVVFG